MNDGEGQALALRSAARCFRRSAGACPPRSFDPRENRTQTQAISRSDRGMTRDRPSPYGDDTIILEILLNLGNPAHLLRILEILLL